MPSKSKDEISLDNLNAPIDLPLDTPADELTNGLLSSSRKDKDPAAVALGRKGGKARAAALGKGKRTEIARKAAQIRWKRTDNDRTDK